ncbi:MAG: YceI family protein [Saprospiraceae bacterium]|nr:YceI family protein [Saprospiraceae bacterium]
MAINILFLSGASSEKEVWLVKANSSLTVAGKTNINSFTCLVQTYGRVDTILCERNSGNKEQCQVISILTIPIGNFDCRHRIMTKDLQKTLKSDKYPDMIIDFKSFSRLPSEVSPASIIVGKADIRLAGVSKNFAINFSLNPVDGQNVELIGSKSILFSEFGLKPPSKLGGAIKVKDLLEVEFKLQLKRVM